jgi:hypothetical protein
MTSGTSCSPDEDAFGALHYHGTAAVDISGGFGEKSTQSLDFFCDLSPLDGM